MKIATSLRRPLLLLAFSFVALTSNARALITVSWGTESEGRYLASSDGSLLPEGSLIWLGSFDGSTDFLGNGSNFDYLSGKFTQLGTAYVGDGGFTGVDGAFAASSIVTVTNTPLFYWAFNSALAASATEWGIFTQTSGLWTTPSFVPNSLNTDLVDADSAQVGALTAELAKTAALVPVGPGGSSNNVPDSSSWVVEFLTALALAAAARRVQSSSFVAT